MPIQNVQLKLKTTIPYEDSQKCAIITVTTVNLYTGLQLNTALH